MFGHLISDSLLEGFTHHLESLGINCIRLYSKGTTGLVFLAVWREEKVIIKLQRPDSPRKNLRREAELMSFLVPFGVTPPLVAYGEFRGLEYIVRRFAEGEVILRADVEKRHIFEVVEKTALLDRLGLDHGQIQGGKHIIIGERVWIIDFEKANWRKPKNLTSAMAMLFLNDNVISRRVRTKFGIENSFLSALKRELVGYKRNGKISGVLSLLSDL